MDASISFVGEVNKVLFSFIGLNLQIKGFNFMYTKIEINFQILVTGLDK